MLLKQQFNVYIRPQRTTRGLLTGRHNDLLTMRVKYQYKYKAEDVVSKLGDWAVKVTQKKKKKKSIPCRYCSSYIFICHSPCRVLLFHILI